MRKRFAIGLITAGLAVGGILGPVAGASARTGHCVSKKEYKRVQRGFSEHRVTTLFETSGKLSLSLPPYQTRDYRTCARFASVSVRFKHHRAIGKFGFWA